MTLLTRQGALSWRDDGLSGNKRALLQRLRAAGFDTLDAERTLRVLEKNLKVFEERRDSLEPKEH